MGWDGVYHIRLVLDTDKGRDFLKTAMNFWLTD
jgi:hypothetical protein